MRPPAPLALPHLLTAAHLPHHPPPTTPLRALKTKHETPKYGLIYHASLIGQSGPKFKGKISRVLAAKCSLAIRVDALGESTDATIGIEARAKVEARLRQLEGRVLGSEAAKPKGAKGEVARYEAGKEKVKGGYNADADAAPVEANGKEEKKEKVRGWVLGWRVLVWVLGWRVLGWVLVWVLVQSSREAVCGSCAALDRARWLQRAASRTSSA